jgi:ribonuclease T1
VRSIRRARRPLVALVALVVALGVGYGIKALNDSAAKPIHSVALTALPAQAATTVHLIEHGGPFPYPRDDGVIFHNDEHRLPSEPDGYYHEYTVPTPGSADRGARRIITGEHGEYYWSADHYDTFERIELGR